jgi:hypothetical protein
LICRLATMTPASEPAAARSTPLRPHSVSSVSDQPMTMSSRCSPKRPT